MTFNNRSRNPLRSSQHCCDLMAVYADTEHGMILYRSYFREYAVKVGGNVLQQIQSCPWCGINLPSGLSKIFFDTVKTELGVDVILSEVENLPPEFCSEEWWRKRGL